jgi:hypothetical protein
MRWRASMIRPAAATSCRARAISAETERYEPASLRLRTISLWSEGVENENQPGRGMSPRPLLFLHVPKTAGTSFILALQNLFGDRRVTRLDLDEPGFESTIERCAAGLEPGIACLTGHVPAYFFAAHWDRFVPFTILRHPVRRVFSLYRFLRRNLQTPRQFEEHGLAPGFGFEDFISCRHPRVYGQTNNGMVRFLCGKAAASDPAADAYWSVEEDPGFLTASLAVLQDISFGIVESMDETRLLIGKSFRIPFELEINRENVTTRDGVEKDVGNIRKVIERNTLDLALYERAASLFRERLENRHNLGAGIPSVVFRPAPGETWPLDRVEGRQGFYEYEPSGFAWLGPAGRGAIHFVAPAARCRASIKLYAITKDYPVGRLAVRIDGKDVSFELKKPEPHWSEITTSDFASSGTIMKLEIVSPYTIPVEYINPSSRDRRRLSVAVSSISFTV